MKASQSRSCFSILIFIFIIIFFRLKPSEARPEKENPLVELSTRAEMVEMAGYGEDKLSSVLVTGSVLCEARMDGDSEPHSWPVLDAKVAVACRSITPHMKPDSAQALTDNYGDFIIDLPSHLHAIPNLEKACVLSVLSLPESSPCNRVFTRKPKEIKLASIGNGIRTYSTGTITLHQHQASQLSRKKVMEKMNFW